MTQQLNEKKGASVTQRGGEDILDSEQYGLMRDLKAAKLKYRNEFEQLKELRSALDPAMIAVAEAKQNLIDEFNRWVGTPLASFTMAQPEVRGETTEAALLERFKARGIKAPDHLSALSITSLTASWHPHKRFVLDP